LKDILFALSEMLLLGLFKVSLDSSEAIWRTELTITKLNILNSKPTERLFPIFQLAAKVTDNRTSYLKYPFILITLSLSKDLGFWGFGEIGRASCRERVFATV
jgi:hypothetical protein